MRELNPFLILVVLLFLVGFTSSSLLGPGARVAAAQSPFVGEDEAEDTGLRFGPATLPRTAPVVPASPAAEEPAAAEVEESVPEAPEFVPPPPPPRPAAPSRPAASPPGTPAPKAAEMQSLPGPLERLAEADGAASFKARLELVRKPVSSDFVQQPMVAVSDGATPVFLRFRNLGGSEPPNLVLSDMKMIRLSRSGGGHWVLEAVPREGTWEARVFVISQGKMWSVPVVVTPLRDIDFDGNGRVDEADYQLFRRAETDPRFDLSGDGERGVADEFIFLANYLLTTQPQTAPPVGSR
ncbi:hypothetical protein [Geoalkalibacter halelectricus]|uniref:hypothetical protein n=1 Tax=Geoalkalibacter halelectricus TaxID=2847045 RepID=UPI003D1FE3C8